ncbi:hypothetical protein KY359_01845 [Candidatus Woesearchaeota archaeon]|nr:hypothetical protein [Candidatus Woesearchaeota archaeon]
MDRKYIDSFVDALPVALGVATAVAAGAAILIGHKELSDLLAEQSAVVQSGVKAGTMLGALFAGGFAGEGIKRLYFRNRPDVYQGGSGEYREN